MKSKLCFVTPRPFHKIYQNKLLYDELLERGWDLQYNHPTIETTHMFCTSNSEWKRTEKITPPDVPIITWIPDVYDDDQTGYIDHIRKAWKVIAICEKQRWLAIEMSGRYRIDLLRPCIDNHTIAKVMKQEITKKDQIVVVGALNHIKKPYIPFLAWKELPKPRPDLIYITYGVLEKPIEGGDYDVNTMSIRGLYAPQLMYEAEKYGDKVKFLVLSDEAKYEVMAESKLLVMADEVGGFNLPPIEAAFCGTNSLISDKHWDSDMGESGGDVFYFESGDIGLLSNKINMWFGEKYLPHEQQQYTIEACADRLESKFKEWGMEK